VLPFCYEEKFYRFYKKTQKIINNNDDELLQTYGPYTIATANNAWAQNKNDQP